MQQDLKKLQKLCWHRVFAKNRIKEKGSHRDWYRFLWELLCL